ncbi:hypothetical protein [Acinetobacter baumannii]|uniref:hypothetical protein n=1 Tax=Acinetobacter baumannii TaxID=470 RepID=UPI0020234434|nr:hypothetical protein [Acinetobacter baumannii]MCL8264052.1 hypothetical protein [Acinetobacter baumannii]
MRNLKYLIFIILSLFSVQAFAVNYQVTHLQDPTKYTVSATAEQACIDFHKFYSYSIYPSAFKAVGNGCYSENGSGTLMGKITQVASYSCPKAGWPIPIYFTDGTPIPLRTCNKNPDGTYCITEWTGDKNRPIVISGSNYQSITHASVSEIPSPSCTPLFSQDTCDSKDPYGGCYKPPNDGCNRMSDGSIYCPPDVPPPPIKSGCSNNATYCDRPPEGCGTGYVSGTYNGKQICVKNSNPPPTDPPPQPPPASEPPPITPDPSDPPDGDPPPPTPPPPVPPDNGPILRAILDAVNAVNNKLTWLKNELVNSLNYIASKIDGTNAKLDTVNQKLDTVNDSVKATTAAVNANGDKVKAAVDANATTVKAAVDANTSAVKGAVDANTNSTANKLNEVVNAINNKPVGGGGTAVNMGPTNDLLTEIKDFLKEGPETLENEKPLDVKKEDVTDYARQDHVVFGQYCPFSPEQTALPVAPGYEMTVSSDLTPICTFGEKARPIIQLIGHLGALLFVLAALRGKD